jgi:uncharacterized membrane protein
VAFGFILAVVTMFGLSRHEFSTMAAILIKIGIVAVFVSVAYLILKQELSDMTDISLESVNE